MTTSVISSVDVRELVCVHRQRLARRRGHVHAVALHLERHPREAAHGLFVLDDEHRLVPLRRRVRGGGCGGISLTDSSAGNSTWNVVPRPTSLSTSTVPPAWRTMP